MYLFVVYWTIFPYSNSVWLDTLCVVLHGVLSWSSLLIPLPSKRNYRKPMIWPEFRLHSIVFATRHVVGTIIALHDIWPSGLYESIFSRLFLILLTQYIASVITNRYGSREARTTNSMPYPDHVTSEHQMCIKRLYADAQFGATTMAVYGDPTCAWLPLLAIQGAALLMTLVRKNKISATAYHVVYASLIWINWPVFLCMYVRDRCTMQIINGIMCRIVTNARLRYRVPSYLVWSLYVAVTFGVYPVWLSHLFSYIPSLDYMFISVVMYAAICDLIGYTRLVV